MRLIVKPFQNDALFWGMLRDRPNYQQQGFIPSPSSPTSSTASKCRGIRRGTKQKNSQKVWLCCCYCSSSSSSFVTSIGVFILVLAYTVLGAFIFMALEGGFSAAKSFEVSEKALAKTDASDKKQKLISNEEIRLQTVEKLWSITEDLNILYKENWTRLATQEVLKFQESLVRTFKNYGSSVSVRTGSLKEETAVYYTHHQHRWSFASSFLYSLTVITTIEYFHEDLNIFKRVAALEKIYSLVLDGLKSYLRCIRVFYRSSTENAWAPQFTGHRAAAAAAAVPAAAT
ncbi:hypothetical protein RUM44_012278 [Polyplax serrata]|uniref:Uncharacterized protein n=1 Tax=Polyplax serrata TaxID=468196 RepID=A0ABR1BB71_POLSC